MCFRNKHQTEWDIKEYLTALAFYFKVVLMPPHWTHYGTTAEQFKSLNADTMRCIVNDNKRADASIKKQKERQKTAFGLPGRGVEPRHLHSQ